MKQEAKQLIHQTAKEHVTDIQLKIKDLLERIQKNIYKGKKEINQIGRSDQMVQVVLTAYNQKRAEELILLRPSPYFVRCEITLDTQEKKTIYFAKFHFIEEGIYSWITPAAAIRFEKPGTISYTKPDGSIQKGVLERKDQYMIVDGHIVFLATESLDTPRELIYQEHFSTRKTGFVLPEIVEQMEKAQDQVIRTDHRGPFVISGPAGSGKTTLALHRVAYLVQAPDTIELFRGNTSIVFVQDTGTKKYFSHLLPELGITDVPITTFSEWAFGILDLTDATHILRYGQSEQEKDLYEWQKLQALREAPQLPYSRHYFSLLEQVYTPFLSEDTKKLLKQQRKENVFDRFDVTILLQSYLKTHKQLEMNKPYYVQYKNAEVKKKEKKFPLEYSLTVIDEFQNYLPEQIRLIKECLKGDEESLVYVGDMAQQVHLGTIREWDDIGEVIEGERNVVLQKVYRNTKYILEYIRSLGYTVAIPKEIKSGIPVVEEMCETKDQEISYINALIKRSERGSIGILAKDEAYLVEFKKSFSAVKDVYILTMNEAQGVEFDIVCIVGINEETFSISSDISPEFFAEKERIQKDLLYVALTRAMSELYILGRQKLSFIV